MLLIKMIQTKLKPLSLAIMLCLTTTVMNQSFAYTNGDAGSKAVIVTKSNGEKTYVRTCVVDFISNNVVCGNNATANQNNSVVIGEQAQSSGLSDDKSSPEKLGKSNTVAIGFKTNATGFEGTSVGSYSRTATRATALGHNAQATGNYSVANGHNAVATRNHSIAIGSSASVLENALHDTDISNNKKVNISGASSETESVGAIAIGRKSVAAGYGAGALGLNANASAAYSQVFGSNSNANHYGSLALGGYSSSQSELGVALGTYSYANRNGGNADAADPLGVGDGSNKNNRAWVSNAGSVSVGSSSARNYAASVDIPATSRQIINVAAGSQDSDAVNVAQLKAAGFQLNTKNNGGELTVNQNDDRGDPLTTQKDNKIQNGEQLIVGSGNNIHLIQTGNQISIATKNDVVFNSVDINNGPKLNNNGLNMNHKTISNVANGVDNNDAVNVSQLNEVKTELNNHDGRINNLENSLGTTNTNITNLSNNLDNLSNQTWKLQVNSDSATNSAIKSTDTVNIHSGKNIKVSKTQDASDTYNVNIETLDDVEFTSANIGGIMTNSSGINMDGKIVSNLSDGVNDNDAVNVKQLNSAKNTVTAGNNIQVKQSQNANGSTNYQISTNSLITESGNTQITDDGVKVGNINITNNGINMANHKITNVENGEISINSKDAINGSQLYNAMNNLNQNMTSTISNHVNQLENRIDKVENEHKAGVASAMAIAGLTQAYLPGKNMFSMAGSVYQGHAGYAMGLSSISDNGKWIVKGTVSSATKHGKLGATAGFGYQW